MSKNFFAALDYEDDDDEDNNDNTKKVAAAPKKEVVTVDVTAGTTIKTTTTKPKPAATKPVGSAPLASTRAPAKSQPRTAAPVAAASEGAPAAGVLEPVAHEDRRRPTHNDRHTKFGRGGSNNNTYSRDKRHTYDRRSGTGRGREVRKDGAGPHNWGSDQNDARQAEGPVSEENVDAVPAADDERVEGEGVAAATGEEGTGEEAPVEEEEEPAPVEEEDNTMTYEEYLASRQLLQDNVAFAPVKERELTADEFAGLKLKPKTKEEEDDFFAGSAGKTKRTRVKKEKQALVPAFRVASGPDEAPRRREGGRGGGRGGRGGFEPREGGGRGSYEPREGGGRGGYEPREGGGRGGYDVSRGGGGFEGGRGGGGFEGGRGDGEGRGGRGRGRGGRGRGGFRGGGDRGGFGGRGGRYRERTAEINVADPESFPAL